MSAFKMFHSKRTNKSVITTSPIFAEVSIQASGLASVEGQWKQR